MELQGAITGRATGLLAVERSCHNMRLALRSTGDSRYTGDEKGMPVQSVPSLMQMLTRLGTENVPLY